MKRSFIHRFGALTLSLALVLSLTVVPVSAAEGTTDQPGTTEPTEPVEPNPPASTITAISLNTTNLTLYTDGPNKTATLVATLEPKESTEAVTWTSSNTSVAAVSDKGLVTGTAVGTAIITATAGGKSATCSVKVEDYNRLLSYSFGSKEVLYKGQDAIPSKDPENPKQHALPIYPTPSNATIDDVKWTCDDEEGKVITIEADPSLKTQGIVTIKGPGNATVKATIPGFDGEVQEVKITVSGIILNVPEEITIVQKESRSLSVVGFGEVAASYEKTDWYSDDQSIVTVSSGGRITGNDLGSTTITVTKGGYSAKCVVHVIEDTSTLAEAGTTTAGSPLNLNTVYSRLDDISRDKTKTEENEKGHPLDYITNLNVSTDQGIVHYGYVTDSDTGSGVGMLEKFYVTPGSGKPALNNLYFVPRSTFSGNATVTYTGYATNGESFNGTIRIPVEARKDVTYITTVDTPVQFQGNDFNTVCRNNMGRSLNYVTFTLPNSKDGTLYYNYTGSELYATKVTASTKYTIASSPYIDEITFVPAANYTGDVTINYRAVDTSGGTYNGKMTIKVSPEHSNVEAGEISYPTPKDTEVSFITKDFINFLDEKKGGTLDYIRFDTLPTSSQGSLRYEYKNSSNTGTAVTTSQRYFRIGSQNLIADLSFIPARDFEGQVKLEFTAYNTGGTPFSGILSIEVGETTGGRTVRYEVGSGRSVRFVAADFNEACLGVLNKPLTRIQFEDLPNSSRGTLYLNYNSSTGRGTAVRSKTNYYYNSSPRISDITFVGSSSYSGTVRIGFTGYTGSSSSDESFTGTVEIMVTAGTPNVTYYSTTNAGTVRLNGSTLASACNAVMSNSLSYIQFTGLPSSTAGHLYRNYNGFNTGTQVSTGTQYYVNGNPSIDQLTFVPRNTFQGVASLSYTGYSTSGEQVSGRIDIAVSNGGVSSSFNDMGNYSWASSAVNYLSSNGVVNGVGNGSFGPGQNVRRCDFVVMLCRAFGFTSGSGDSGFDDVPAGSYYSQAVATAKNLGIVSGTGGNSFTPNGQLTRQDGMLMIRNALSVAGWSIGSDPANLDSFADGSTVSGYARNAVSALVQLGAVSGDSSGRLRPHDPITRAEMAVVLHHIMTM